MSYRTVSGRFWRDPSVKELSKENKLLFLYFITSADAHYSGLYYCPIELIHIETGLTFEEIKAGIDTLSIPYMIRYDWGTNEVFVSNMAKFQVKSRTQIAGVANHFKENVQSQELIKEFMKKYNTLAIPYRYPIDTTETDRETETETETESKPSKKQVELPISGNNEKRSYGEDKIVFLTDEQHSKLEEKFGVHETLNKIENLAAYMINKEVSYKSHYHTILTWHRNKKPKFQRNGQYKADKDYVLSGDKKELAEKWS